MADNVTADPGTGGAVFATDAIGSAPEVHYPYSKLVWGPDNTVNLVGTASGKPLPIQVRSSGGTELGTSGDPIRTDPTGTTTQPVSGTVIANLGTIADVATQTTLNSLNGKVTACNTGAVTVSGALPTGDNAIGRVKLTDGTEVANVDASNRLEVAVGNTVTVSGTVTADAGTGPFPVSDNGGSLTVDGAVTVSQGTPASLKGQMQITDGTEVANVNASNQLEVAVLNTPTVTIGTFPDNEPFNVAQYGGAAVGAANGFYVRPGTGAVFSIDDNSSTISIDDGAGSVTIDQATASNLNAQVVGNVAHDSAVSGNPVRIAGRATTSEYTKVADGDVADIAVDAAGRQIISLASAFDLQTTVRANLVNDTDTQLIAQDASYRFAVMAVLVTNASNSVSTKVAVRDGTTDVIKGFAYKDGGGFAHNGGGVPLFIGTLNTALKVQCGTTGADVEVVVTVAKVK